MNENNQEQSNTEIPDKLVETSEIKRDENGRIIPGQPSLNPLGRGAGVTLKEYKARKFKEMTDEDKEKWLKEHKVSGEIQWRMAEGNPKNDLELSGEVKSKVVKLDE